MSIIDEGLQRHIDSLLRVVGPLIGVCGKIDGSKLTKSEHKNDVPLVAELKLLASVFKIAHSRVAKDELMQKLMIFVKSFIPVLSVYAKLKTTDGKVDVSGVTARDVDMAYHALGMCGSKLGTLDKLLLIIDYMNSEYGSPPPCPTNLNSLSADALKVLAYYQKYVVGNNIIVSSSRSKLCQTLRTFYPDGSKIIVPMFPREVMSLLPKYVKNFLSRLPEGIKPGDDMPYQLVDDTEKAFAESPYGKLTGVLEPGVRVVPKKEEHDRDVSVLFTGFERMESGSALGVPMSEKSVQPPMPPVKGEKGEVKTADGEMGDPGSVPV